MLKNFLIVGIGSFFGGGTRYITQLFIARHTTSTFPMTTFAVNIIGSFIIGLIFGLSLRTTLVSNQMKLLLATGFCGGFTTFSSFSLDTFGLLRDGQFFQAASYITLSLVLGVSAAFLGIYLVKRI